MDDDDEWIDDHDDEDSGEDDEMAKGPVVRLHDMYDRDLHGYQLMHLSLRSKQQLGDRFVIAMLPRRLRVKSLQRQRHPNYTQSIRRTALKRKMSRA